MHTLSNTVTLNVQSFIDSLNNYFEVTLISKKMCISKKTLDFYNDNI